MAIRLPLFRPELDPVDRIEIPGAQAMDLIVSREPVCVRIYRRPDGLRRLVLSPMMGGAKAERTQPDVRGKVAPSPPPPVVPVLPMEEMMGEKFIGGLIGPSSPRRHKKAMHSGREAEVVMTAGALIKRP